MKWTVYNKEKPQKVGSYLVTHTTDSGQYYVDYDYWTVCDEFKYHPTDVVAWMPFPKPYSKTEPQKKYPTEWCENCELWQDNNCMGVAECKRIIEMLTDVGIMKTEPQTDCEGCDRYEDGGELCDMCALEKAKEDAQTERSDYHRSRKVCTLELFDNDGVYIEP